LHGIRTGIAQQLRLIEELLDVSRVIQGNLPLTRHTFALTSVVRSTVESMHAAALGRGIDLTFSDLSFRYTTEETIIESDPCRVQQALHLLLSHAMERSPQHETVEVSMLRERNHAAVCVAHRCSHAASGDARADEDMSANMSIHQKDSRQQMNLLLARCLAERMGGNMTTTLSSKGDKMSHTLRLPLPVCAEMQTQ
jgi:K+-sensing histidine kinase KdpD